MHPPASRREGGENKPSKEIQARKLFSRAIASLNHVVLSAVIPADTFSRMSQRVQSSLEAVVDLMVRNPPSSFFCLGSSSSSISSSPLHLFTKFPHMQASKRQHFLTCLGCAKPQGQRSAKAQGLGSVITTVKRMMYTDHKLFVHRGDRTINGILKIGKKKLFHRDSKSGKMHEIEPLCVLDFYVHESMQRCVPTAPSTKVGSAESFLSVLPCLSGLPKELLWEGTPLQPVPTDLHTLRLAQEGTSRTAAQGRCWEAAF